MARFRMLLLVGLLFFMADLFAGKITRHKKAVNSDLFQAAEAELGFQNNRLLFQFIEFESLRFSLVYRFSYSTNSVTLDPFDQSMPFARSQYFSDQRYINDVDRPQFNFYAPTENDRTMKRLGLDSGVNFKLSDNSRIRLYGNRIYGSFIAPFSACFDLCQLQLSSTIRTTGLFVLIIKARY